MEITAMMKATALFDAETEIEADAVSVFADDGTKVELQFRKSDGDISLSVNGTMLITPIASNMVRIARIK